MNNAAGSALIGVALFLLITTLLLTSMCCTRNTNQSPQLPAASLDSDACRCEEAGIDEATINGYPKLLYSQALYSEKGLSCTCCSICLVDYNSSDVLRFLPDCNHYFHVKCIDPWLRLHPTCPVCRKSPFPTPLSTPLAEVASNSSASGLRN